MQTNINNRITRFEHCEATDERQCELNAIPPVVSPHMPCADDLLPF